MLLPLAVLLTGCGNKAAESTATPNPAAMSVAGQKKPGGGMQAPVAEPAPAGANSDLTKGVGGALGGR